MGVHLQGMEIDVTHLQTTYKDGSLASSLIDQSLELGRSRVFCTTTNYLTMQWVELLYEVENYFCLFEQSLELCQSEDW